MSRNQWMLRLATVVAGLQLGAVAQAAIVEGSAQIFELREIVPSIGAAHASLIAMNAPATAPVVWRADVDPAAAGVKELDSALLQSGIKLERSASGALTLSAVDSRSDRDRAAARLLPVLPQAIAPNDPDAVQTGAVAVFGTLLEAPFKFEVRGESVLVNGIEVFPSPGTAQSLPRVSAATQTTHDRLASAIDAYSTNLGTMGVTRARQVLATDLSGLPGISGLEWVGNELRLVRTDGIDERFYFDPVRETVPASASQKRAFLEEQATVFADELREGTVLLFGATYVLSIDELSALEFAGQVESARQSNESEALRIARLQAYTLNRDAAADLVFAR